MQNPSPKVHLMPEHSVLPLHGRDNSEMRRVASSFQTESLEIVQALSTMVPLIDPLNRDWITLETRRKELFVLKIHQCQRVRQMFPSNESRTSKKIHTFKLIFVT